MTAYTSDGWSTCHFCGTQVKNGREFDGTSHLLQDCRPDLVEHPVGELCTWPYREPSDCWAYIDPMTFEHGSEHKHFFPKEKRVEQ